MYCPVRLQVFLRCNILGEPGADEADLYVRGIATWNNAKPLIQVDGVEREFSQIDPNEVESITVLKDASATAVFGVRGANGVILITTKRGAEGKAKISFSTSAGVNLRTKQLNLPILISMRLIIMIYR